MQKLLDVQKIDLKIQALEAEVATIPMRIRQCEQALEAKRNDLAELQGELDEGKKTQRTLERKLEEKQMELGRYNEKLPQIKTNREYKAILLEIDTVEKDISDIEEEVLRKMTDIEEVEARIRAKKAEFDTVAEETQREREKLEQKREELRQSLDGNRFQRDNLAANVDDHLLSQYDRIRSRKGGVGLAQLDDESCSACHMALPPQLVNEVIGGAVKSCPSCQRLLYWIEA
jgi:predicted  nucleic acid-binding Zn-ribbon protein